MQDNQKKLQDLVNQLHMPDLRKDLSKEENLFWLTRNIGFIFAENMDKQEVIQEVQKMLKPLVLNKMKELW